MRHMTPSRKPWTGTVMPVGDWKYSRHTFLLSWTDLVPSETHPRKQPYIERLLAKARRPSCWLCIGWSRASSETAGIESRPTGELFRLAGQYCAGGTRLVAGPGQA